MQITAIDIFSRHASSTLITFYQKKISPRKGFSCAHRILHGGESCSQYIKRTIWEQGWGQALPLIRSRFQACKTANQTLRAGVYTWQAKQFAIVDSDASENDEPDDPPNTPEETPDPASAPGGDRQQRTKGGSFFRGRSTAAGQEAANAGCAGGTCSDCGDGIDCTSLGCDIADCSGADCSGFDCSSLDCSGMDCSSLDCSGMDCDFGSCS